MKKDYYTHSFQKQQTNKRKKKKENGRKRKSRRCLHQFLLDEKQHFFRYIPFSRNRKIRQNKKNKCKTCPTKKDNKVFFVENRKKSKESLTKVYKDS